MRLEYLSYVLKNLKNRPTRSWLTVLSILIGIAAIFALVSFGNGLSKYVEDLSSEIGTDKLIIQAKSVGAPGSDDNFYISQEDIDFISKVNGVSESQGFYFKVGTLNYKNEQKYIYLTGYPTRNHELFDQFMTIKIDKGRILETGNDNKVVLGYLYSQNNKIFKRAVKIHDKIEINGKDFQVIGFYESLGNAQDDSNVYVTVKAFEELYPNSKDKFAMGVAVTNKGEEPSKVAEKVTRKLRNYKDQEEGNEDFFVQTLEQTIATFNTILDVINAVLLLIALISVLVAAINITNTMYTSVIERTSEIGIMKAIGAKNSSILTIFLLESGIVGLVGSLLGVILGFLIASLGGFIAASAGYGLLKPVFTIGLFLGCLAFGFITGLIAGYLPSKQASKLKPVDALRYE